MYEQADRVLFWPFSSAPLHAFRAGHLSSFTR